MRLFILLIITLMLISFQSMASDSVFMSLNAYHELNETEPDKTDAYISGLIAGYTLTNAMLEKKDQSKLYCLPKDATIKTAGIKSILNMAVSLFKETKKLDLLNTDVGGYTLSALTDTYPCKK